MTAPGAALVRENVEGVAVSEQPGPAELDRVGAAGGGTVYTLFDLAELGVGLAAARRLAAAGTPCTAARGRVVPAEAAEAFERLWLAPSVAELFDRDGHPLARPWRHPVVPCEAWRAEGHVDRLGAVFSRLPDPGLLDLADVGRAGIREGAANAALPPSVVRQTTVDDLPAILDDLRAAHCERVLLVDNGAAVSPLAAALLAHGALGGFVGPARRPVPDAVVAAGLPVYTWFEVEDLARRRRAIPAACHACAYVPIGLPGESPAAAAARCERLRAGGYAAIVPRFHLPVPATREWQALAAAAPLRHRPGQRLDGSEPIFMVPGWEDASAQRWVRTCIDASRWPAAAALPRPRPRYSLGSLQVVLNGVLADARAHAPEWHTRQLLEELLREVGGGALHTHDEYPFLRWNGESLRDLVDRAIEARLRTLDDAPAPLADAIRHTALAGGKRIRPILAAAIGLAAGAPIAAVLPAVLAVEWLHTASLVQDDLPCMDDDPQRRHQASAHVRHGEGMALLASDALVAMAVGDLAALAAHPAVGPARACAMLAALADALGAGGLVGGQAHDLLARAGGASVGEVLDIHRRKTAPLFQLAAALGAILADLPMPRRRRIEALLADLGLAFQIVDDLLDTNEAHDTGVTSDERNRRATIVATLQRDRAMQHARDLVRPVLAFARQVPAFAALGHLAAFVLARRD